MVQQGERVDFRQLLGETRELFLRTWWFGAVLMLLQLILLLPVAVVVVIPVLGFSAPGGAPALSTVSGAPDWGQALPFAFGFLLATFLANALVLALTAGYFRMVQKVDRGHEVQVMQIFNFLRPQYFTKALVLSAVSMLLALAGTLLLLIPLIYLMVPLALLPLIMGIHPNFTTREMLSASFLMGHRYWWICMGLLLLMGLLAQLIGLMLCGIGVFFTASLTYLPLYLLHKHALEPGSVRLRVVGKS